jgi:uncharacterized protein YbjT (DUF2867 family)
MTSDRTILITGVTGNQGGAVAQALQGTGFYLRGLTRMPDSERAAALAREAGVEHYVYTSVGSAHKRTGIPHFDNKWRIEETVRSLRFPSHVILRPVFFMENLPAPYSLQGPTLAWALRPSTKLQMIAVDDIGWFSARAFTDLTTPTITRSDSPPVRALGRVAGGRRPEQRRPMVRPERPCRQQERHVLNSEAPAPVAPTGQTQGELA